MEEYLVNVMEGNCFYCIAGFLLLTVAAALLWIRQHSASQNRREPPGPRGIPFLGQLPFAGKNLFNVKCMEWARTYGPVFKIQLGAAKVVVLNDYDSIRKYLVKREIQYRPENILLQFAGTDGVGTLNGQAWIDNRLFCVNVLRDRGAGSKSMQRQVADELQYLCEKLVDTQRSPISFREYAIPSVCNNVSMLLFGVRYPFEDHRRKFLDENVARYTKALETGSSWIDILPPLLKKLAILLPLARVTVVEEASRNIINFASREVREHEETMNDLKSRDFIDDYLKKIHQTRNNPNSNFTYEYLVGSVMHLLIGGSVSVASHIHWHMLNCAHNMDTLQERIQSEIDRVVGAERQPEWEDRHRMPFTMATVWEMYRRKPGSNLPRGAGEDTFFGEYFIPKKTIVLRNKWAVHMNPEVWKDPMAFDPTRFLSSDGSSLVSKPCHLIPFSVGKRMCPGENFTTMQIFLYLATLLQKFRVLPEDGHTFSFPFSGEGNAHLLQQKLVFVRR